MPNLANLQESEPKKSPGPPTNETSLICPALSDRFNRDDAMSCHGVESNMTTSGHYMSRHTAHVVASLKLKVCAVQL